MEKRMRKQRLKKGVKPKDIEDEKANKKDRQKVEKKELSYVGSESKDGLLQHMETDSLEQEEGKIFVTAGVKCVVLFQA